MQAHRPPRSAPVWARAAALATALSALAAGAVVPAAHAATPAELLAGYTAEAGAPAQAQRGQAFFTQKHGRDWACATCHGATPTGPGRHETTAKLIRPLAPVANAERFTELAKADKWFRRNCKDVLGRECSAGEKADVLAWLLSLSKP